MAHQKPFPVPAGPPASPQQLARTFKMSKKDLGAVIRIVDGVIRGGKGSSRATRARSADPRTTK
jgi:hypothetical protein